MAASTPDILALRRDVSPKLRQWVISDDVLGPTEFNGSALLPLGTDPANLCSSISRRCQRTFCAQRRLWLRYSVVVKPASYQVTTGSVLEPTWLDATEF